MEEKIYLISKKLDSIINIPGYRAFFNLFGWDVFSIPKIHYEIFKNHDVTFFEISKDEALAFKSFGDSRATIKVSLADDEEFDTTYDGMGKTSIEVTEKRYNNIIKVMKLFAKILLEEEYNRRYKKLNYDYCDLEVRTWGTQVKEIEKYELGYTSEENVPLLHSLSSVYGISLSEVVSKIKETKENHDNKVNQLYLDMLAIKNEFKLVNNIEDLNLLYIKYFNVHAPFTKEYKESRPDLFDENGNYKYTIGVGYNF